MTENRHKTGRAQRRLSNQLMLLTRQPPLIVHLDCEDGKCDEGCSELREKAPRLSREVLQAVFEQVQKFWYAVCRSPQIGRVGFSRGMSTPRHREAVAPGRQVALF